MQKSATFFGLLFLLLAGTLRAQSLEIVSTDPAEGEAGVPLDKKVIFNLSRPLPAFGSIFSTRFTWSPTDSTTLSVFGHDLDADGALTVVFFTLNHTPNTDFSFFAYGLEAADGSTMERPFALNYSTAAEMGTNVVSGTADFKERFVTGTSAKRARLQTIIREALAAQRETLERAVAAGAAPRVVGKTSRPAADRLFQTRTATSTANLVRDRTVLLLLQSYELSEREWRIHAAAPIAEDGSFAFEHVRDGTYWPIAINWADSLGDVVGAYGFYDANGDFDPDPVTVNGGDVSGLDVGLFALEPAPTGPLAPVARERAARVADDQRLIEIIGRDNADGGASELWLFIFYSPSRDTLTYVNIDPVNVLLDPNPTGDGGDPLVVTDHMRQQTPLPETMIDSETAFQIAWDNGGSEYRAQFDDSLFVPVVMMAGDLELDFRPPPGEVFWSVTFQPPLAGFDELTVFVDVETGEVLAPVFVATEPDPAVPPPFTLRQNYPNPFNPTTEIRFDLSRPGPVRLAVYDLLGREVRTLVDGIRAAGAHAVVWDGRSDAGETVASGVYLYRMEAGGFTKSRMMVLMK
ncbi:FlgD immunoglobulin-like domain containing protein [Rhodocaloribacter sp.]